MEERSHHQAKVARDKHLTGSENFDTRKKHRIFVVCHKKSRAFTI
jgi:hypothetical protein